VALTPGSRIGSYEIAAQIGVGGMGEVYRATDTNLGRQVAIKVLPETVASDGERLARFDREARTLASLNHPNIAAIYGLERSPSTSSGQAGMTALVMELVEGPTLADRIAQGPIPLDEAVPIAQQIADALEAAHDQGIVHRDLKPANIKLRPDGTVKVLDFGLAKAADAAGATSSSLSMSPTITTPAHLRQGSGGQAMTQAGLILGTAPYMSPEQAKGKAADRRSDVWSFGAVLFEMLSGRRAFEGEDVADTIAAVLRGQPDWSALPAPTPPAVVTLLKRCLERDQRRRFGNVAAALAMIEERAVTAADESAARTASSSIRMPIVAGAVVLAAVVGAVTTWIAVRPSPPAVSRLVITPSPTIGREGRSLAISPDGSRIAYIANSALFVRSLDRLEPQLLAQLDDITLAPQSPFFSPDGQWVGYFVSNNRISRVQVTGGPSTQVTGLDAGNGGGASWAEDGTLVFATLNRTAGLYRLAPGATDAEPLTTPDREAGEADHLWPEFLPGGRAVLFTIVPASGRPEDAQVAVLDLDTGADRAVVPGGSHAHYVATGHLVYSAAGELRAIPFDLDRLETTGLSMPVEQPVVTSPSLAAEFDVSRTGTLVYLPGTGGEVSAAGVERRLVWVSRNLEIEPLDVPRRAFLYPRLSSDGTRVLLDIRDRDNDIWLLNLQTGSLSNLTRNPALDRFPLWEPDGEHFVFVSDRENGESVIFRQRADGVGEAERLSDPWPTQQTPNGITPDGSQLVFDRDNDLLLLTLDGSRQVTPLVATPAVERRASLSPDGRWLAYHGDESGQMEVYVQPFPNVEAGKVMVSTGGGVQPWWSRTGDELLFFTLTGEVTSVPVGEGSQWTRTRPTTVLEARDFLFRGAGTAASTLDVSSDGRQFLMIQDPLGGDAPSVPIVVVQHWFEELRRLAPAD